MKTKLGGRSTFVAATSTTLLMLISPVYAFDEDAAKALAKKNDCFKCHAIDKTKKGPSYKKISEKYKGKTDAEADLIKHITTGPKVKLEDGTQEDHKIIDTKDIAQQKNLVQWIMAQ